MRSYLIPTTLAVWLSLTGATAAQGVDPTPVGWRADLPVPLGHTYLAIAEGADYDPADLTEDTGDVPVAFQAMRQQDH